MVTGGEWAQNHALGPHCANVPPRSIATIPRSQMEQPMFRSLGIQVNKVLVCGHFVLHLPTFPNGYLSLRPPLSKPRPGLGGRPCIVPPEEPLGPPLPNTLKIR